MNSEIKISIPVNLKSWDVPDYATIYMNDTEFDMPIEDMDDEALLAISQKLINDIYSSINKRPPVLKFEEL